MRKRVYEYLPPYLREVRELFEIASACDFYIGKLYDALLEGIYGKTVSYASEESLSRWEKLLKIAPASSLEERRNNLKSIMRKKRKLNEETIKSIVKPITGGEIYVDFFDSVIYIRVKNAENQGSLSDVRRILMNAVPAHLDVDVREFYPSWKDVKNNYESWERIISLNADWSGLFGSIY